MVRRSLLILFEALGILLLGAVVGGLVLYWRLGNGPISIAYLTPYFENALGNEIGLKVELEDTTLAWNENSRTVDLELTGATLRDNDGAIVLEAPELGISLSGQALLHGIFAPHSLIIAGPTLRVSRDEQGEFTIGADTEPGSEQAKPAGPGLPAILDELAVPGDRGLGYLQHIQVRDADLIIDDRRLDIQWAVPNVTIEMTRTPQGLSGQSQLELQVGDKVAALALKGEYRGLDHSFLLTVGFADVNPKVLASLSAPLAQLEPLDVPVSGTVSLEAVQRQLSTVSFDLLVGAGQVDAKDPAPFDVTVERGHIRGSYDAAAQVVRLEQFDLGFGSNGVLNAPAPLSQSFPVRSLNAYGSWSIADGKIDVPSFRIGLDQPAIEGTLALTLGDGGGAISTSFEISGLTFDDAAKYWPEAVLPDPRSWVVKHMPAGKVTKAAIRLDGSWAAGEEFQVQTLGGELAAADTTVDYLPPMPKVQKAMAHATFNSDAFDIDILGGQSQGLTVKGGHVRIGDLQKVDQWTDVDLTIEGPVASAFGFIESPPLRFASALGFKPAGVQGTSTTHLKLRFIAENKLKLEDVQVHADADLKQFALPVAVPGIGLSDGDLHLVVDSAGLDLTGQAAVNGIPATLAWRQNFSKKAPFAARYQLQAEAEAGEWRDKMGLDSHVIDMTKADGPVGVDLTLTTDDAGSGKADATVNLAKASLAVSTIGWQKPAGEPAQVVLQADLVRGHVSALPRIKVEGGGLAFEGEARFDAAGKLLGAEVAKLTTSVNDFAGSIAATTRGWDIGLHGRMLDLKAEMEDKTLEDPNPPPGPRLNVTVNLDKVRLHDDRYVSAVSGTLVNDGLVWTDVHLRGGFDGGSPFSVAITPQGDGRSFQLVTEDAGAALHALDVSDSVLGGHLEIKGIYANNRPRSCVGGVMAIDNFRVINAPIMARLLNAASVIGLVDVLTGEGLKFDSFRASYTKKDGITRFENAKASGISMGFTASGSLNNLNDTINIEGSIVPANVLNSVLGKLPLVGGLFGGASGIFAINYKIEGDKKDPSVTANPLTVLTPGFTRNIFNIFDKRDDEAPPGCPKQG